MQNITKNGFAIFFILGSLLLVGCSASPIAAPEPEVSEEPVYVFYPNGSASQNLPIFEYTLKDTGAGSSGHKLQNSIKALVDAGFELESITHTAVISKTLDSVDSVSLAIDFGGKCLMAQFSNSWLSTAVSEPTVSGCLIGDVESASLTPD